MRKALSIFAAFVLGACVALPPVSGSGTSGGGGAALPQPLSTTDKPQFLAVGIGGAAGASDTLTFYGSTSGSTLIQAAAVTTQSITYSLPSGDGNAWDVWTTDGSGHIKPVTLQAGTGVQIARSGTTMTFSASGGGGGGSTSLNPTTSLISIGNALDNNAGSNLPQFTFGTTAVGNDGDPTMVGPSNDKLTICSAAGRELQLCVGTTFANPYIDMRTNGIRVCNGNLQLQTGVLLQVNGDTTGSGSAALGANCPAVTATAPYTWVKLLSSDGSTVYVPAYK